MRRILDVAIAGIVLLASSPLLVLVAAAVWLEDGGPVFFRQVRLGQYGKPFTIFKFRTMGRVGAGALVTSSSDVRITRVGRFLRRYKLDELPQLWNVVNGEMSLIGPRPEVPRYVDPQDPAWTVVHAVKPGITDLATLVYRDEEKILASYEDPEQAYREEVLPKKLALNLEYLKRRSPLCDLKLLVLTARYSFIPSRFDAAAVRETILPRNS